MLKWGVEDVHIGIPREDRPTEKIGVGETKMELDQQKLPLRCGTCEFLLG